MWTHALGQLDALNAYGLEKSAIDWGGFGRSAKQIIIGEPGRTLKEFRAGTLHRPGGLLRESVWPTYDKAWKTWGARALNVGVPVLGAVQALGAPESQQGSALGNALGAAAGGLLGSPFGLVGQTAGGALGGALGRSVGSAFDTKPKRERPYYFNSSFV